MSDRPPICAPGEHDLVCHCGSEMEDHGIFDNHGPTLMGCAVCERTAEELAGPKRCESCEWFDPLVDLEGYVAPGAGICRYNPPTATGDLRWAMTNVADWCSKWEQRTRQTESS